MKIKKTYQGELPENKIVNTSSTSQTDTYSCDYINNSIDSSREKSAILVTLSENKSFNVSTAWGDNIIPFDTIIRKIGDGFMLETSTGTIKPADKVKNVKITLGLNLNNTVSGQVYPRIYSQSGISNFSEYGNEVNVVLRNETVDKCDTSKIIKGGFRYSTTGEVIIKGWQQSTFMLVEEL